MRRLQGPVVGAVLAVALLAWATRPVPRLRLVVPGVRPDSRLTLWQANPTGPAARWAILRDGEHDQSWAIDHRTGRLAGPWPVPDAVRGYVADADGRLYAHAGQGTSLGGMPLTVWQVDPATGTFNPHYEIPDRLHITPTVWAGEPAWRTFTGNPLRLEVIDLASGAIRRRIALPSRAGDLIDNGGPYSGDWDVSADGRWLAMAESWDGVRRTSPPGVELWDVAAGRLARRIAFPLPHPERGGAHGLRFAAGGLLRFVSITRDKPADHVFDLIAAHWRVRLPDGPVEPDPTGDRSDIPDLHCEYHPDDSDHGRRLVLGQVSRDDDAAAFVVVGDDLRPLHPRRVLPVPLDDYIHDTLRLRLAADGTSVLVWSKHPDGPSADWLRTPLTWVGFPPFRFIDRLDWHDWRTGESWRLRSYPGCAIDVACQPGGAVVLAHEWGTDRAVLEVWPAPPGRWPAWGWWVLASVCGGLIGWGAFRRSGCAGHGGAPVSGTAGPTKRTEPPSSEGGSAVEGPGRG